ncbi:MAG: threonine aldolase [Kiritimatiellia bacterium]|jgi:threonine aldolase
MIVDLRSDTVTRPSEAMLQAMIRAPLGDDVLGDDPSVRALEEVSALRAGKQAGLFVPSGTMGNQIAIRVHTRPGDEVLCHEGSHPFNYEAGGAAVIAGVQLRPMPGERGLLDPAVVLAHIRSEDPHHAPATLLAVEDTCNRGGGTVHPVRLLHALADAAHGRGLATHMDGARVFNAVVASGVPLAERVAGFDSLTFCLSKGLGCPVGSVLCGSNDFIHTARRVRKMLGGGMRQAGVLAAAGLYALEHNVDRLADDHRRAMRLSRGLQSVGYSVVEPETNMVYVTDLADPQALVDAVADHGVLCFAVSSSRVRLVVHLDVLDEGIDATLGAFTEHAPH